MTRRVALVFFQFSFVVLLISPFFVFGGHSAIGWYDEADAVIPWTMILAKEPQATFVHEWAGGIGATQNFLQGNERFSLLQALYSLFGAEAGTLIFRCLFMAALMIGVYLSSRRNFGATPLAATVAAQYALLSSPINYGWIAAAGSGWLAPFLAWFALAASQKETAIWFGALLVCTSIFVFVGNPIFMAMCLPVFIVSLCILGQLNRSHLPRVALLIVILSVAFALNYLPQLGGFFEYLKNNSARYLGYTGLIPTPVGVLQAAMAPLLAMMKWDVYVLAFAGLMIALAALWVRDCQVALKMTLGVGSVLFMCVALLVFSKAVPGLPLAKFRWDVPLISLSVIGGWVVAVALSAERLDGVDARSRLAGLWYERDKVPTVATVLLAFVIAGNAVLMVRTTLSRTAIAGGWGIFKGYPSLQRLYGDGERVRVISSNYASPVAAIAALHGLDAFDGMSAGFSWRRSLFFQQMIQKDPDVSVHTHHQGLFGQISATALDALRMANVGFVLSAGRSQPFSTDLPLVVVESGKSIDLPLGHTIWRSVLGVSDGRIHLVPPLYVWRLPDPWSRIFISHEWSVSDFPETSGQYWRQLQSARKHAAIFSNDSSPPSAAEFSADSRGALLGWALKDYGFAIETNARSVLLVVNQVFDRYWSAHCGDRPLKVRPVNGIMMAVFVPNACRYVELRRQSAIVGF